MALPLGIHMDIFVDDKDVEHLMWALWVTLLPNSLAKFHGALTRKLIIDRAHDRFASEGDNAVGGMWDQLTQSRQDIREHAGFNGPHPINKQTGQLEQYILKNQGRITKNALGATFSFPGAVPRSQGKKAKYDAAQKGKPAGFPMPDGRGGTKPSPSPTPPRPVVGLDALDMVHVMAALELFIPAEVQKLSGGTSVSGWGVMP